MNCNSVFTAGCLPALCPHLEHLAAPAPLLAVQQSVLALQCFAVSLGGLWRVVLVVLTWLDMEAVIPRQRLGEPEVRLRYINGATGQWLPTSTHNVRIAWQVCRPHDRQSSVVRLDNRMTMKFNLLRFGGGSFLCDGA